MMAKGARMLPSMAPWAFASPRVGQRLRTAWRRPREDLVARLRQSTDLLIAAPLAVLAALLASLLPAGNPVRIVLTLTILLTVPGYLLLQAIFVPARPIRSRAIQALLGIGVSPVIVGLLALSTALLVGGFGATAIIVTVTLTCLALALVAFVRRSLSPAETAPMQAVAQAP